MKLPMAHSPFQVPLFALGSLGVRSQYTHVRILPSNPLAAQSQRASLARGIAPFSTPCVKQKQRIKSKFSTKLAAGLRSVARNNKATRLLTRPGQTTKSSAKDLILLTKKLQYTSYQPLFHREWRCRSATVLGQRPIHIQL